jgi:hypothetical protein
VSVAVSGLLFVQQMQHWSILMDKLQTFQLAVLAPAAILLAMDHE